MDAQARDYAVAALGTLMANPDAAAATCAPSAVSQLVKALALEIASAPSSQAALELLCLSRALAHQAIAAEPMVAAGTLESLQRIFSLAQAGTIEPAMVIEATTTLQALSLYSVCRTHVSLPGCIDTLRSVIWSRQPVAVCILPLANRVLVQCGHSPVPQTHALADTTDATGGGTSSGAMAMGGGSLGHNGHKAPAVVSTATPFHDPAAPALTVEKPAAAVAAASAAEPSSSSTVSPSSFMVPSAASIAATAAAAASKPVPASATVQPTGMRAPSLAWSESADEVSACL